MGWKFVVGAVYSSLLLVIGLLGWSVAGPAGATVTPGMTIYLSSTTGGSVGGVTFADEDVVAYDIANDTWSMVFDGSDVGLASADVDGFTIVSLDPFVIEMSFSAGRSIAGVGIVDDSDVVRFSGTGGPSTSGGFLLVIDGSDIGFSTNNEDLDAVSRAGSDYILSSFGPFNVPGLTGDDEDLVTFSPTSIGSGTAGVVSLFRDGTADGLGPSDVTGLSVDLVGGMTYGAALTSYTVGTVSGDGDDVFKFPTLTMPAMVIFDGDMHGFAGEQIDGVHIGDGSGTVPENEADLMVAIDDNTASVEAGGVINYTVTVTNNGPDAATNVILDGSFSPGLSLSSTTGCMQPGLPCLIGSIGPEDSAVVTVVADVALDAGSSVGLGVEVTSAADDQVPTNNTASITTTVVTAPIAVDDGPADDSMPGDPFHIAEDDALIVSFGETQALLNNDDLGDPAGDITSFGGGDVGGNVESFPTGTVIPVGADGSLRVSPNGGFSFTPPTGFLGAFTVDYRLSNPVGASDATLTIYVGPRPSSTVYLSSTTSGVAGGVAFADEDIVYYDEATDSWGMLFDGSDVGLQTADVDGFHIRSFEPLVIDFSLTAPRSFPGVGATDDSDVVTFTGMGGTNTSGTFALLIDGSDLGLSSGGEDVDAVAMLGSEHLFSTLGNFSIPGGLLGADEDILALTPTSTGPITTGALALAFDGSDVDLGPRDVTAVWADPGSGDIHGSALGNYTIAGISGDSDDVFAFTGTTGSATSGTAEIVFDGDLVGFGGEQIDGLHIEVNDVN